MPGQRVRDRALKNAESYEAAKNNLPSLEPRVLDSFGQRARTGLPDFLRPTGGFTPFTAISLNSVEHVMTKIAPRHGEIREIDYATCGSRERTTN